MSPSNLPLLRHPVRSFVCDAAAYVAGPTIAVADCSSLDVASSARNADDLGAAVVCRINAERTQRGLGTLRENAKRPRAALAHSSDTVRDYFAHAAPDGYGFLDRILGSGYSRRNGGSVVGEALAWGTGDIGTARAVHAAWMRSSRRRANILMAAHRQLGVGVGVGVPKGAGVGAPFATDFGGTA